MNLASLPEWIFKYAGLGVTAWGVYIASQSLKTWQYQIHGQANFDLARRLTHAVYRLQEEMRHLRFTSGFSGAKPSLKDSTKARVQLVALQLEAKVLWGAAAEKAVDPILACSLKLDCVLRVYFKVHPDDESEESKKLIPIAEGTFNGNDKFDQEIIAAVDKFEHFIRPYLPRI